MLLEEHLYSVLIVSTAENFNNSIKAMLSEKSYRPIDFANSVSSAQRMINTQHYDLVIINAPLTDSFGNRLAIDICSNKHSVAILIVKYDVYETVYSEVLPFGVLTLKKPVSSTVMSQTLDLVCPMIERLKHLDAKTISLTEKMAEIRIINKAKWALIEHRKMTEEEAHKFIEKRAMDACITKGQVAQSILKNFQGFI